MTPELLKICTGCKDLALAQKYAEPMSAAMFEFGVDTSIRQAAYLAQVGHESGGLLFFHEKWGPTPTQRLYEPPSQLAVNLGNIEPGDGQRFAGRGPIQITGRYNYRMIGIQMNLDLEKHPELLDDPVNACRSSGAFWKWKNCNQFADARDFVGLTKRINGGTNGLADRLQRWIIAKKALGV